MIPSTATLVIVGTWVTVRMMSGRDEEFEAEQDRVAEVAPVQRVPAPDVAARLHEHQARGDHRARHDRQHAEELGQPRSEGRPSLPGASGGKVRRGTLAEKPPRATGRRAGGAPPLEHAGGVQ